MVDGDSRPGIAERYASEDAHVSAVIEAAERLAKEGYLPIDDQELVATRAAED